MYPLKVNIKIEKLLSKYSNPSSLVEPTMVCTEFKNSEEFEADTYIIGGFDVLADESTLHPISNDKYENSLFYKNILAWMFERNRVHFLYNQNSQKIICAYKNAYNTKGHILNKNLLSSDIQSIRDKALHDFIGDKLMEASNDVVSNYFFNRYSSEENHEFFAELNKILAFYYNPFILIKEISVSTPKQFNPNESYEDLGRNKVYYSNFKIDIFKELKEDLARRYAILDKPSGKKNLIVDSFLPKYFIKGNFSLKEVKDYLKALSPTTAMIHRGFANLLEIKQVPIVDMIAMLGYTPESIKNLLTQVKSKEINMIFAGLGGVGTNTMYWLTELCEMSNISALFKKIAVFDNDKVSVDNMFRMPMPFKIIDNDESRENRDISDLKYDIHSNINKWKIDLITENMVKALSKLEVYKGHRRLLSFKTWEVPRTYDFNWICYGAPDIDTRRIISNLKKERLDGKENYASLADVFISTTHGDNDCTLDINPVYDASTLLLTESYGIIQLNVFFMNQLRLAIGLLETLAKYSYDELKGLVDHTELEYSFIQKKPASNKFNIAFQNISTINTVENIENGD